MNDSKKLSEKQRYALRSIIEKEAISWAIGIVSPEEIDKINILKDEAGVYNILFINRNGKKYLIERDRKVPDIFEKFYREVLYYRDIMKQIVEYEKVFNDKIEYKTKIRMLGY